MQVPTHEEVLRAIDAFLDRHPAIGASRFGRDATGEPGLVARLRKGSTPTLNVLARIKAFMDAKDADLSSEVGQHERFDTARGVRPSSGTETNFSASIRTGAAVALVSSEAAVAEGEGVSPLPGGACT